MFGCIGACREFTLYSSFSKNACIFYKQSYSINGGIQIVFDFIEITVIVISDLVRDVTFGNSVNIFSSNIQWPYHSVQSIVDTLNNCLVITLMFRGIGTCCKFTLHSCFRKEFGIGNQRLDIICHFLHCTEEYSHLILAIDVKIY